MSPRRPPSSIAQAADWLVIDAYRSGYVTRLIDQLLEERGVSPSATEMDSFRASARAKFPIICHDGLLDESEDR